MSAGAMPARAAIPVSVPAQVVEDLDGQPNISTLVFLQKTLCCFLAELRRNGSPWKKTAHTR
jgi:hypothetical protein